MASFVQHQLSTSVAAGSSSANLAPIHNVAVGNTLVLHLWLSANGAATAPTVSSIGVPTGETASWVRIRSQDAPSSSGLREEVWAIKTQAQTWVGGQNVVITFSGATGSLTSPYDLDEFSGTSDPSNFYAGNSGTASGATNASIATSASVNAGDLVVGSCSVNNGSYFTDDSTDTTGGAWTNSGGGVSSGVSHIVDYKIPTAAGTQTYNPTAVASGLMTSAIVAIPSAANDPITMIV